MKFVSVLCSAVLVSLWTIAAAQRSGDVRLAGGTSSAGRLEVFLDRWGTVCDDGFGRTEANVVCRQLGYSSATEYGDDLGFPSASFSTPIWLDDVICRSSDTTLLSCAHRGIGLHNCDHSEDVGLRCTGALAEGGTNSPTAITITAVVVAILYIVCIPILAGCGAKSRQRHTQRTHTRRTRTVVPAHTHTHTTPTAPSAPSLGATSLAPQGQQDWMRPPPLPGTCTIGEDQPPSYEMAMAYPSPPNTLSRTYNYFTLTGAWSLSPTTPYPPTGQPSGSGQPRLPGGRPYLPPSQTTSL